jgi:hypothetical protein
VLWRADRLLRALALVALLGLVAYLFTPLGAAGQEGVPTAFGINVRFVVPALLLAVALLPMAPPLRGERAAWVLLAALLGTLALTDRSDQVVRAPGRLTGAALAALFVVIPAALWVLHRRGRLSISGVACGLGAVAVLAAVAAYPAQRDYLADRWRSFDPGQHMDSAYRWAAGVRDSRIGLAGTTIGFLGYGFYGKDLSNRVLYLGQEDPHGSFNAIRTCTAFRRAVDGADLDYLVTGPFLNFAHQSQPIFSPETSWVRGDPALHPISRDGSGKARVTVWKIDGRLDPAGCAKVRGPTTYLPNRTGQS